LRQTQQRIQGEEKLLMAAALIEFDLDTRELTKRRYWAPTSRYVLRRAQCVEALLCARICAWMSSNPCARLA
jgi:hypothetical protein